MRIYIFLVCFLIISCDLPSEANKDCSGVESGLAKIDDCGICAGGDTGRYPNSDKDCCGDCFGDQLNCNIPCFKCGDQDAINFNECAFDFSPECVDGLVPCCDDNQDECSDNCDVYEYEHDSSVCIYDLCTDYFDSNNDFNCTTQGIAPYAIGEQLSCEDIQTEFDICFPSDCGSIKLADFEDKIIFIVYEEDW